jgi:membrane associated rhomboid family serine protease
MNIPIVFVLIFLVVIISNEGFRRTYWRNKYLFNPYAISNGRSLEGIFSHFWFHADWQHLLFNMISLFMLGGLLEEIWVNEYSLIKGTSYFLAVYLFGGVAATVIPYYRHRNNPNYRSLGASGAVSAVVFATIIWEPNMRLGLLFIPIPIPAYLFGPLYLAFEYFAMRRGNSNIANDGHISGALFGILFVAFLEPLKITAFLSNF